MMVTLPRFPDRRKGGPSGRVPPACLVAAFTALISLFWVAPAHSQTTGQIIQRALWDTPSQDLFDLSKAPFEPGAKALRNSAVLLGLFLTDPWTTRMYQRNLEPVGLELHERLGIRPLFPDLWWTGGIDGYTYTAVAGLFFAGVISGKPQWQEASVLTTKAMAESYVIAHLLLKTAIARHRPNRPVKGGEQEDPFTRDPFDFFNWHRPYFDSNADGTAFPSWHFALYFSAAKVLQRHFDNYWVPYTLCMFPLLYEAEGHRHWVSDMVAGAALGTLIGKVVYENYHREDEGDTGTRSSQKPGGRGPGSGGSLEPTGPGAWEGILDPSRWSIGLARHTGGWVPAVSYRF